MSTSIENTEGFVAFCKGETAFSSPYPAKSKQLVEWCDGYASAKRLWELHRQVFPQSNRLDMLKDIVKKIEELKLKIPKSMEEGK